MTQTRNMFYGMTIKIERRLQQVMFGAIILAYRDKSATNSFIHYERTGGTADTCFPLYIGEIRNIKKNEG